MIKKISHIGIAVKNLQEQIVFYRDVLQLPFLGIEEVAEQKVKVAMFEAGEVHIELLEPTQEDSPIAKFMEKKGEGIHHVAYEVDNIENQISHLQKNSVKMIDEKPRTGAHECQIAFVHPKATFGVLTELCQSKKH